MQHDKNAKKDTNIICITQPIIKVVVSTSCIIRRLDDKWMTYIYIYV